MDGSVAPESLSSGEESPDFIGQDAPRNVGSSSLKWGIWKVPQKADRPANSVNLS